jgi:glycosyltransferase involved in cell wall biosynthesis
MMSGESVPLPSARPNSQPQPRTRRRILFAKLGSFSHTNERLLEQIAKHYPDHEVITFDLKAYVKRELGVFALNGCLELATYGASALRNASDRHAFFFLTPFMFRHLSAAVVSRFGAEAESFDFVLQTQGLFNAALPGRPFVIYTDHTLASVWEYPVRDERQLRSPQFLALERALYHRADKILVTAGHVKRTLERSYGCDAERVVTIMIGANVQAEDSAADLARYAAGRILFVGIDWERKGGPTLLAAFDKVARRFPQASLTIVGSAPAVSHPRIRTLGRVERPLVAAALREASIFCLPSVVEPSAVASVEAMAFRLPVVATTVGGFPEMVRDQATGILVPPSDPDALAEALDRLLADPALAQRMGQAGHERSALFTWDAVGTRFHAETRLYATETAAPAAAETPFLG